MPPRERWAKSDVIAAVSLLVTVAIGIADHFGSIASVVGPFYPAIQPVLFAGLGALVAWSVTRAFYRRRLDVMRMPGAVVAVEGLAKAAKAAVEQGPLPVTTDTLSEQPWEVRRAVLESAQSEWRDLPLEKAPDTVLRSMLSDDGILHRRVTFFSGMESQRGTYYVDPSWKLLLMQDGNLEKLRVMVSG